MLAAPAIGHADRHRQEEAEAQQGDEERAKADQQLTAGATVEREVPRRVRFQTRNDPRRVAGRRETAVRAVDPRVAGLIPMVRRYGWLVCVIIQGEPPQC